MPVKLIDYTGAGSTDPLYAARLLVYTKNTRLKQGEDTRRQIAEMSEAEILEQLDYMSKTIPSSWEFVNYTFELLDIPVATMRQIQRTRTGKYAEQSMRVVDMRSFKNFLPDSVRKAGLAMKWDQLMQIIAMAYKEMYDAGVPAEDARGVLPMNTLSSQIVQFDLRTLSDLIPKRKSLRAQGMYREIAAEMEAQIYAIHPWAKLFIAPDRTHTPFLDKLFNKLLGDSALPDNPDLAGAIKEIEKLKGTH